MRIVDVLSNLRNFTCWEFKHYPMRKEEADICIEALENEDKRKWIPCSGNRFPKEKEEVEVTVMEDVDGTSLKRYYTSKSYRKNGQWIFKKNQFNPTIIAWRYPSEPYVPKEE